MKNLLTRSVQDHKYADQVCRFKRSKKRKSFYVINQLEKKMQKGVGNLFI